MGKNNAKIVKEQLDEMYSEMVDPSPKTKRIKSLKKKRHSKQKRIEKKYGL